MSFIMEGESVTHYVIFPMMQSDSLAQLHVSHTGQVIDIESEKFFLLTKGVHLQHFCEVHVSWKK
jgi:hypothetical protein